MRENKEINKILSQSNFYYGYVYKANKLAAVDVWTGPLSIGESKEPIASQIAKKYNVNLIFQDFSRGRDEKPNYKPAFGVSCKTTDEIKEGIKNLELAERELKERLGIKST